MRVFISLFLIVALTSCVLANNECNENIVCPSDAPEICIFNRELYCFIKFENLCVWNDFKCKYNIKFQIYAPDFCELENFACTQRKSKHEE